MRLRAKDSPETPDTTPSSETEGGAPQHGKGRPTPKRKQAEAANKRPLVPTDRRAASKEARAAARAQRDREYRAMQTGDERYMPVRDKGPARRWVRDFIDARLTTGEFFLPVALVALAGSLVLNSYPQVALFLILGMYAFVLITVVDAFVLSRILKKRLRERFGDDVPRGTVMYGVLRAFQIRRARMPRPMVKRGQHPA